MFPVFELQGKDAKNLALELLIVHIKVLILIARAVLLFNSVEKLLNFAKLRRVALSLSVRRPLVLINARW